MGEKEGRAFYFGTYGRPGHGLRDEYMQQVRGLGFGESFKWDAPLPWVSIDGTLPPCRSYQGEAALHHKDGWTALAFWDRTDDERPGSNAAFFFEGTLDFAQAVAEARRRFPQVIKRFAFEIRPSSLGAVEAEE